jgi:alpha/beta superfamily hydrolase
MPEVIFPGPAGRVEGRYHEPPRENAPIALILHGHPRAGGSMQDRVSVQLYKLFVEHEFAVLRFNFRGIGRSQGVFDNGMGELSDAASALDYLQSLNPTAEQCWVGGYSFGAWVGLQLLMRRPEINGFLAISPPTNHYDLSFLAPCPASGIILYGTRDNVTTAADMERVVSRIRTQKNIKVDYSAIDGANHFYFGPGERDLLPDMEKKARAYLERRLAQPPPPPPTSTKR